MYSTIESLQDVQRHTLGKQFAIDLNDAVHQLVSRTDKDDLTMEDAVLASEAMTMALLSVAGSHAATVDAMTGKISKERYEAHILWFNKFYKGLDAEMMADVAVARKHFGLDDPS